MKLYNSSLQRGWNYPLGRFYVLWGRYCYLRNLGGDFSFQGGDCCRLKYTTILNWFQKSNSCFFGIKAFDALSTPRS